MKQFWSSFRFLLVTRYSSHVTHKGFTLIEVLIALAILTVVLGAVYSSFFTVQGAIERFDDVSLRYHEVRTALDIMRREVEAAFIVPDAAKEMKNRPYFLIEDRDIFGQPASRISFTTFISLGSGVKTVSYLVEEKDGALELIKTESPAMMQDEKFSTTMIEQLEGFKVEAMFNNKWVTVYDTSKTNAVPDAVKVSITFEDKGKEVTLTEYARPKVGKRL
ncbi:MAG: prepilin-type N-terminal cleavage/methylation domain-containing protein [Nitrospirae bacterium]|nr:prepilin-type N-terminal cleavage/methylation domain-containing protein [Nitrospirota bacterium]